MSIYIAHRGKKRLYHILVSPGDAPGAIALNVVSMEREFYAYKSSPECAHLTITVSQLFEPQVQKIAVFTYRSPHFCMHGKTIQCLPNPLQHVPIYLQ